MCIRDRSSAGILQVHSQTCRLTQESCASLGRVLSPVFCECECPPCPGKQISNETNCECECQDDSLRTTCLDPLVYNTTECSCLCPESLDLVCEEPQLFNESSCKCECSPTVSCSEPKSEINPTTCECQCPTSECSLVQFFNSETCRCECGFEPTCRPPQQFSEDICACTCLEPVSYTHLTLPTIYSV